MPVDQLLTALHVVAVVLCAWAYPELNAWVYRRRIVRDEAWAARAGRGDRAGGESRTTPE